MMLNSDNPSEGAPSISNSRYNSATPILFSRLFTDIPMLPDPFGEKEARKEKLLSPLQTERNSILLNLPKPLQVHDTTFEYLQDTELQEWAQKNRGSDDVAFLKKNFPLTVRDEIVQFVCSQQSDTLCIRSIRPLNLGLILSGGPAPGGHNVIAGVFDRLKLLNINSNLYGFIGGVGGMLKRKYMLITRSIVDSQCRNLGGFDVLCSGRGKVGSNENLRVMKEVCEELNLDGIVVIGGDGSNSNAAIMAEYLASEYPKTVVVGVPKTIDGDLQNPIISTSFGFDTASKTYSECIGNLCTDAMTRQTIYHFIRVMGRSASHLVLECAMQTRPNLVLIGEEIYEKGLSLQDIVNSIADLIERRAENGKLFGVILIPEGLVEFIPEMKVLFDDIENLRKANVPFRENSLPIASRKAWEQLPIIIRDSLLVQREASGYVNVAKIPSEKLLIHLVEEELSCRAKISLKPLKIEFMPHYFGYEGRCAMPSNFDAIYCYVLGVISALLVYFGLNGYMTAVKNLSADVENWIPVAIPFPQIMNKRILPDGDEMASIIRSLVDLNGPLFKILYEVRDKWAIEDVYRSPGPIQFDVGLSGMLNYMVSKPTKEQLLYNNVEVIELLSKSNAPVPVKYLSELQLERLNYIPEICRLLVNPTASMRKCNRKPVEDPFTCRQILMHYPHLSKAGNFFIQELAPGSSSSHVTSRNIGVAFLSNAPGLNNIISGLLSRLNLIGGNLYLFQGYTGLIDGDFIKITNENIKPFLNLGGIALIKKFSQSGLMELSKITLKQISETCQERKLDGLVIAGSATAMNFSSQLSEYFLRAHVNVSVVGVPATSSNNLVGGQIEACVGFDTSTKVYASIVGNILSDAASMPKYWHFIRLMGRQPSHEVVECALQTHPNVVIIAEEYGASGKSLLHVVLDIADVVCKRASVGRQFGTVLIPDSLLLHLPNMKLLLAEISKLLQDANVCGQLLLAQNQLATCDYEKYGSHWIEKLTAWSAALFKTFPQFIRRQLVAYDMGELRFRRLETEQLLAIMVQEELSLRSQNGKYSGNFSYVTHYLGYQGKSSMPSTFDATLGYSYGHLASILIESGITGHCCTIRGLCGAPQSWKCGSIPFVSMMQLVPTVQSTVALSIMKDESLYLDAPVIPHAEVIQSGNAFRVVRASFSNWAMQDRFRNPGPLQLYGPSSRLITLTLQEEQLDYFHMLKYVESYANVLRDTCRFGVSHEFLRHVFVSLSGLLTLALFPDSLHKKMPSLIDINTFDNFFHGSRIQREEEYQPEFGEDL